MSRSEIMQEVHESEQEKLRDKLHFIGEALVQLNETLMRIESKLGKDEFIEACERWKVPEGDEP